jgi:hypothetical protein
MAFLMPVIPLSPRAAAKAIRAYIHIYLIDPTEEGKRIADDVVGTDGEGEVDPVASATSLRDRGISSVDRERGDYDDMHAFQARHEAAKSDFSRRTAERQRPRITAAYPEVISPQAWSTVDLFVYLEHFEKLVKRKLSALNIGRISHTPEYRLSSRRVCQTDAQSASCVVRVRCGTNPSEMSIGWYEPYNRLSFRVSPIDEHRHDYSASLDVDVFADDLPVASMRLPIMVTSEPIGERMVSTTSEAQWYENIFASYAREDLEIVEHLKERYEALGLYLFIDVEDIRAGTRWRSMLLERIDSSDLFQLFWSSSARKSKYVSAECDHALQAQEIKGGRFIRPVFWEDPIPEIPENLRELSFRRIRFAEERMPNKAVNPSGGSGVF